MTKAVYPGSFDPPTNGHLDVVRRASALFDELIVGVYDAPPKNVLFTTRERVELFKEALPNLPNIQVLPFKGLVVDFCREVQASAMVRGLRAGYDFEYEFEMALMNRKLAPDIEMVALMSSLEYQFVSSSRIKEVARLGGNITGLVPENVSSSLAVKISSSL